MSVGAEGVIPIDSDSYPEARKPRSVHFTWRYIGLVLLGGTVGAGTREALVVVVPQFANIAVVIIAINAVGAFCLGLLLESLARGGADVGRRRGIRLLIGTGVLGGFTTYSTLATETSVLMTGDRVGAAFVYALGTLVAGGIATFLGVWIASARHHRRVSKSAAE